MVRVLQTDNYGMSFNSPRISRHELIRTKFFPLRKVWTPLDGLAVWLPRSSGYDLIHSFNRIPLTRKPWIVTFEAELPRTIGDTTGRIKQFLRRRLTLDNCRQIIAMSDYAKFKFIEYNRDWNLLEAVTKKIEIIHPNIPIKASQPKTYDKTQPLQILFVGNHFARKGGIVALRLAKKAKAAGLPIVMHIVSQMAYGNNIYTDHPNQKLYKEDIELLSLDNIVFHGKQPNQVVMELMARSHFIILMSLHDTYGYSVIEGFSVATPAIVTNVCALPEFVYHNHNGYVIPLELHQKEWIHLSQRGDSDEYWDILHKTYEDLAEHTLQVLAAKIFEEPANYESLSSEALAQAQKLHNAHKTSEKLDTLYDQLVNR